MELKAVRLNTHIRNLYQVYGFTDKRLQVKGPTWPVLICILVIAVDLLLLPFIARTWRTTGDEPHYLLAAHSLVTDLDSDLANNYDQFDYLSFYFSKDIVRQVRTNAAGQQILSHSLGLPLLIAPAYALGGRFGVLLFQAVINGLLAMFTFKLTTELVHDEKAAAWATGFVILTPPVMLYQYLVYPELAGALFAIIALYYTIVRQKPTAGVMVLVLISLAFLPWLNRRFVPLAILLAILVFWSWRRPRLSDSVPAVAGLVVTLISVGFLLWFNYQLGEAIQVGDFTAPASTVILWRRLFRGVGWLLDQQRGLFIYAPVYILAIWGIPVLIHRINKNSEFRRAWFVVLPFCLSLGVTVVAGGYFIAWELGPRFLVVALPALAPLIALAWHSYGRSIIWRTFAVFLFVVSLINGVAIINNPELPYKSSLPLYYSQKLRLPLTEMLPDLADYAEIQPTSYGVETNALEDGSPVWYVKAGRSRSVVKSEPLSELPYGHYHLTWPVQPENNPDSITELGHISIKLLGGGPVFNEVITTDNLKENYGRPVLESYFLNPNIDRWRTPMILRASTNGQSDLWVGPVQLAPNAFYGRVLPYFYLLLIVAGALTSWVLMRRSNSKLSIDPYEFIRLFKLPAGWVWGGLLLLTILVLGYVIAYQTQEGRTYPANELQHFVGHSISDSAAQTGQAWLVDPMVDPPQKAIYGPFDIYDAGHYQIVFRIKAPKPAKTEQEIARLQVNATANFEELLTQSIHTTDFVEPNHYQDFVVMVDNPRRQALSFEVHYLGLESLVIDKVTITKITNKN